MKIIFYIYILLNILHTNFCESLNVNLKKEGLYHININNDYHDIMTINGIRYREGIHYNNIDILMYLKKGIYNISTLHNTHNSINVIYKRGNLKKSNCILRSNTLIKPYSDKEICSLTYYYHKKHTIELFGNFNFKNFYLKNNSNINKLNILTNNQNLKFPSNMGYNTFHHKFNLDKGFHQFKIIYNNLNNNYYCNCPSIGTGFEYTKYFNGIIIDQEDDNKPNITNMDIKENILLSNKQTYNDNIFNHNVSLTIDVSKTSKYLLGMQKYILSFMK